MNIAKIIVAVDFSEFSSHIAEYACCLGNDLGAELIFVNVINQRDIDMVKKIPLYSYQLSVKGFIEDYYNNRTVKMNSLLKEINCSKVPHRFIIKKGVPFKELIAVAKEKKLKWL